MISFMPAVPSQCRRRSGPSVPRMLEGGAMQQTDRDHVHLARAIELAARGLGRVSPNPVVGAGVVRDGEVLGEGWHAGFRGAPAEMNAPRAAGGCLPAAATRGAECPP